MIKPETLYVVVCCLSDKIPEIVGVYDSFEKAQQVINSESDLQRFNYSYVVQRQLNMPERAGL